MKKEFTELFMPLPRRLIPDLTPEGMTASISPPASSQPRPLHRRPAEEAGSGEMMARLGRFIWEKPQRERVNGRKGPMGVELKSKPRPLSPLKGPGFFSF